MIEPDKGAATQAFTVRTLEARDETVWLQSLTATDPAVTVRLVAESIERELESAGAVWRLYTFLATASDVPAGPTVIQLPESRQAAQSGKLTPIEVNVSAVPVIESSPASLVFRVNVGSSEPAEDFLNVHGPDDVDWEITGVSAEVSWLTGVVVDPSEPAEGPAGAHRIRAAITDPLQIPLGISRTTLQVTTNHPAQESIVIPVLVSVGD